MGMASLVLAAAVSCRKKSAAPMPTAAQSNASPHTGLDEIPLADSALYYDIDTADKWQNPVIWVRYDRVSVTSKSTSRVVVTTEDLEAALRAIPLADWPYGRAAAYAEAGILSGADEPKVRERRVLVVETTRRLKVTLVVWPTS
ncbi:MAG: hypothetical protein IT175_08050 [Acidobacteria bacterium]|nr:hypothetical protein [Acidobacteriota bacterium]